MSSRQTKMPRGVSLKRSLQQQCTELNDRERVMVIGLKTKSDKNKLQCGCLRSTIKTRHATMQTSFETTARASARVEFEHRQVAGKLCPTSSNHGIFVLLDVLKAWASAIGIRKSHGPVPQEFKRHLH